MVYASVEAHSSVEKAVRIAGLGSQNLRKIGVDKNFSMQPELLKKAIEEDLAHGKKPIAFVATIGTTGSASVDPLPAIGEIAKSRED